MRQIAAMDSDALIHTATDARALPPRRALLVSPPAFDGPFDDLLQQYIQPNLPGVDAVEEFHRQLVDYVSSPDPLFLVRRVRGMERGSLYGTRDGVRMKASDNAPAWWVFAALTQGFRIAPDAFPQVMETLPTHFFHVARTCAPTANRAGWHIAHLFDVGDRKPAFANWTRTDVVARFVRSVHPCNHILLPHSDWQKWGADLRVIAASVRWYAERYARIWDDFMTLAGVSADSLGKVAGPVRYTYDTARPAAAAPESDAEGSVPGRVARAYGATRFTLRRDVIESLGPGEVVRIETPSGGFELTKAQVYEAFPRAVQSRSYREDGIYHWPRVPKSAERFRV